MPQVAADAGEKGDANPSEKGATENAPAAAGSTGDAQPDIERIVATRIAQKLSKYGDLDELKRKAGQLDSIEEANKTEAQKLQDRIAGLEKERQSWQQERTEERLRSVTVTAAARLGFTDPEDALGLLKRSEIEFDDSGQPRKVEEHLKALLEAKPYLSNRSRGGDWDGGQRGASSYTSPGAGDMNALLRKAAGRQ